jgi:outer membrane lipoprotein-sorting protein
MFNVKSLIVLTCIALPMTAFAQSPEEKGLEIAMAAEAYDRGFTDFTANMVMTLKNKSGQTSKRLIRIRTLEVEGDGDKSLSIFDEPADVKGTKMLTYSHGLEADDQWLYLPALKKVKRISSRNKSGPFMKYTYKYLRDEACGELSCYVIERYPAYKFSGYTRQVAWIDTEAYRMVKVEFYDRKKSLLKTLVSSDFQQFLGHYWRPGLMDMVNHQTGKSTLLEWKDYEFKTGLGDRDFRSQTLKRIK